MRNLINEENHIIGQCIWAGTNVKFRDMLSPGNFTGINANIWKYMNEAKTEVNGPYLYTMYLNEFGLTGQNNADIRKAVAECQNAYQAQPLFMCALMIIERDMLAFLTAKVAELIELTADEIERVNYMGILEDLKEAKDDVLTVCDHAVRYLLGSNGKEVAQEFQRVFGNKINMIKSGSQEFRVISEFLNLDFMYIKNGVFIKKLQEVVHHLINNRSVSVDMQRLINQLHTNATV